ncbi:MAG TPA: tetratricopeptide repeat protein [Paludibacter sp.]|nr:tetratricopeptide repeat protein [Paludibacter sp.]
MKKVILSFLLVACFAGLFAQKSNISKAKNKALMETPDFKGAREAINLALKDSTTKNLAETWYVAGLIGSKENDVYYQKALLGQSYDQDVKGKAMLESYDYFLQADKLDQMPDAKGKVKPKYRKDIKAKIKEYYKIHQNLINYGAYLLDKKDYEGTVKVFDVFLQIPKLEMMNNEIPLDSTYNMITYYDAIAATNAGMRDKAIALFESLKDKNYETVAVYQLLYEQYYNKKDTANFVKTLKEGFEKFPKEAWFLQNLINYYIYANKVPEALVYLNTAIEREPNIPQYYYVKGNLSEAQGNMEDARAAFDKAIELDPTLADAYAGIGRLYYNKAVKITENANNIKDNKLFNAEQKKAEVVFKESLPFFKKAAELKPKDVEFKKTLKTLYYRLKMDAEFEAISKEINAM